MFFNRQVFSIQTLNWRIFSSQVFKDSKGIAPNVFANILTQMLTENFSPH